MSNPAVSPPSPRYRPGSEQRRLRHLLITRYNITSKFGIEAGIDPTDPAWLEHRVNLFERFCVPSVRRQTVTDFEWVLLVNPDTPEDHLARLGGHARLVLATSLDDAVNQLSAGIPDDGAMLITSRIDNDDAVVPDFLAASRRLALKYHTGTRSAVVFSHGVRVNLDTSRARELHMARSPFLTLVETAPPWRTISWYPHTTIDKAMQLTSISTAAPVWLQTLHGRNVSNHRNWEHHEMWAIEAAHYAPAFPELNGPDTVAPSGNLRLATASGVGRIGPKPPKSDRKGRRRRKPKVATPT